MGIAQFKACILKIWKPYGICISKVIDYILVSCIAHSCLFYLITQQQRDLMARLKRTKRKSVGNVPRLPDDIVAAIAEV